MSVTAQQKLWQDNKRLQDEIDRLRHDIERIQEIDSEHLAEIDRLRAENAELRNAIEKACQEYQRRWDNLEIPAECHSHLEAILGPLRGILAKTTKDYE